MKPLLYSLLILTTLAGCVSAPLSAPDDHAVQTGISGMVKDHTGKPVAGAWVYAYRNTSTSLRGPADFGARTDHGGHFFIDLVDGHYYLVARWRRDGGEAGPPQVGDSWALPKRNPVVVVPRQVSSVDFVLQGVKAGQPIIMRSGSLARGKTGFTGLLVDMAGNPQVGGFALAYTNEDFRRMPDYTSSVVGSDGRFQLFVPAGNRYCLAARTRTRGQPIAGEPYGLLGRGKAGCPLAVKDRLIDVGTIHLQPYQR